MNLLKRTYRLLLPAERKGGVYVAGAVFLTALLNFAGIASLLPVLYLLLERHGNRMTVLLFCLLALAVVLLKSFLSNYLMKVQHRFLLALYKRLSLTLYTSYYHRGLLFIRERGANRLSFEVNNVCFNFTQGILMPLLHMAADGMLLLLVTVAFLIYDAGTMLLLYASFIPFVVAYQLVVKKRIGQYGREEQEAKRGQARVVGDTFRGYAEAEVYGAFPRLWRQFEEGADEVAHNRMQMMQIQRLPMVLSELSVVIGLALLAFTGGGDISLLVGAFALVALRLLPALRSLLTGWTQVQHAAHCLDIIEEGMEVVQKPAQRSDVSTFSFEREISFTDLTFAYEEGMNVIESLNATIRKGEMVGISGQSGVGKSTLFNLLMGFLTPSCGKVAVDGQPLTEDNRRAWMQRIAYVSQEVFIFDNTLAGNIAPGEEFVDRQRVENILRQVALDAWVSTLPLGMDTPMNESGTRLSGGQKQRLGLARALYKQADVLLLDEATSALDRETEQEINDTIQRLRAQNSRLTILYIAHHESALDLCDRVIRIDEPTGRGGLTEK